MIHKKKLLATAVAGALAVPSAVAVAQTSTVQIGGSITAFYYQHKPNNPGTGQKTDILETSEPELFIRGEEKLGGGLSTWFQCTSSIDGLINGAGPASAAGFCGRNSGIGFRGSWGNVFAGNWDTPQKFIDNAARGWWGGTNALTGGAMVLLANGTASGLTNPALGTGQAAFFRRQANSLNYHSPDWNGFSFQGAFSAGNEQTGIPETNPLSPRMWSIAGQYKSGPLYVGLGYENHSDYNPAACTVGGTVCTIGSTGALGYVGGNDTRRAIAAGYTFGTFNVRGMYADMDYDTLVGQSLDTNGWGLFADWNIQGPHTLRAQYVSLDDIGGNSVLGAGGFAAPFGATATGAKHWGLAYSYAFSKRTMGSVAYTKLDNDTNAAFSKGKLAPTAGATQTSFGVVLQHRF